MYEQKQPSLVGKIIWLVVSGLVLIGLIWLILWLLFWRNDATQTEVKDKAQTSLGTLDKSETNKNATNKTAPNTQPGSTNPTGASTNGSTNSGPTGSTTQPSAPQASSTSTSTPNATATPNNELANTGPGDMAIPILLAVAGGTFVYHLRQRRIHT